MNGAFRATSCDSLLEKNGTETRVESTKTFLRSNLAHTTDQTIGESRFRDETNAGGLERAERNVGEELGASGRGKVDGCAVVAGILDTDSVDELLLEEFVTPEFECALEEVTGERWADTREECASTLVLNDLSEAADQAAVVGDGVELDSCLDARL